MKVTGVITDRRKTPVNQKQAGVFYHNQSNERIVLCTEDQTEEAYKRGYFTGTCVLQLRDSTFDPLLGRHSSDWIAKLYEPLEGSFTIQQSNEQ